MDIRLILTLIVSLYCAGISQAVHVIMTGGPTLSKWEGLRTQEDRHDRWWANFVRASTVRMGQILQENPKARVCWIVYKPGYVARGLEDKKPYTTWITELAVKYNARLIWIDTGDQAIAALNQAPRGAEKVQTFYYFGHGNPYSLMLDYGTDVMAISMSYIHETDIGKIKPSIFAPGATCWSYGCYTGMSMSYWWKHFLNVPLWGNLKATRYAPVSNGLLPQGVGRWVDGGQ